jgi:hypothetical protein
MLPYQSPVSFRINREYVYVDTIDELLRFSEEGCCNVIGDPIGLEEGYDPLDLCDDMQFLDNDAYIGAREVEIVRIELFFDKLPSSVLQKYEEYLINKERARKIKRIQELKYKRHRRKVMREFYKSCPNSILFNLGRIKLSILSYLGSVMDRNCGPELSIGLHITAIAFSLLLVVR